MVVMFGIGPIEVLLFLAVAAIGAAGLIVWMFNRK